MFEVCQRLARLEKYLLLNLCRYGSRLCEVYRSYRDAELDIAERILTLENRWLKIEVQVKFLHDVWWDLPPRFQIHFNSLLSVINTKLIEAVQTVDGTMGKPVHSSSLVDIMRKEGKLHRGAFAFSVKDKIDKTIQDLNTWQQNMLDPSWYQLVLVPSNHVSQLASQNAKNGTSQGPVVALKALRELTSAETQHLRKSSFMQSESIEALPSDVEFSRCKLGLDKASRSSVLLDAVRSTLEGDGDHLLYNAKYLAEKLSSIDSETFGLLKFRGILSDSERLDFVFSFPKGYDDPTSLRRLLIDANPKYALNARINIGQRLARSIMFMHTCRTVHKNIRPENVVCFAPPDGLPDKPYLIGLEHFRLAEAHSKKFSDGLWQRDIYRHASRQGQRAEQDYVMQHDIYSLGVCLLEIGFWKSFLTWSDEKQEFSPNERFISSSAFAVKDPRKRAFEIKKQFVKDAREVLPGIMGQKYTETVISCLTCLDPGNTDFGDEKDCTMIAALLWVLDTSRRSVISLEFDNKV